jgi:hypothetical protein
MQRTPTSRTYTRQSAQQALAVLVRGACETLLLAHPTVVGSLTVSRALSDDKDARLAATTAKRLAEEYGVDASVRVAGSAVTVRLSRDGGYIRLERNHLGNGHRPDETRGARP